MRTTQRMRKEVSSVDGREKEMLTTNSHNSKLSTLVLKKSFKYSTLNLNFKIRTLLSLFSNLFLGLFLPSLLFFGFFRCKYEIIQHFWEYCKGNLRKTPDTFYEWAFDRIGQQECRIYRNWNLHIPLSLHLVVCSEGNCQIRNQNTFLLSFSSDERKWNLDEQFPLQCYLDADCFCGSCSAVHQFFSFLCQQYWNIYDIWTSDSLSEVLLSFLPEQCLSHSSDNSDVLVPDILDRDMQQEASLHAADREDKEAWRRLMLWRYNLVR